MASTLTMCYNLLTFVLVLTMIVLHVSHVKVEPFDANVPYQYFKVESQLPEAIADGTGVSEEHISNRISDQYQDYKEKPASAATANQNMKLRRRNRRTSRTRRNAIVGLFHDYKWAGGDVPYTLSSTYTTVEQGQIRTSMNDIEWKTCIRFVERTSQTDYLWIHPGDDSQCWSYYGRRGGRQELQLAEGCFGEGTIKHELMHALGFYHEHSRPDRDNYVRINWNNIEPEEKSNFNVINPKPFTYIDYLNTEYDYSSIMHYGSKAFSKNSEETIKVLNLPFYGEFNELSNTDILRVSRLYNCPKLILRRRDRITELNNQFDKMLAATGYGILAGMDMLPFLEISEINGKKRPHTPAYVTDIFGALSIKIDSQNGFAYLDRRSQPNHSFHSNGTKGTPGTSRPE